MLTLIYLYISKTATVLLLHCEGRPATLRGSPSRGLCSSFLAKAWTDMRGAGVSTLVEAVPCAASTLLSWLSLRLVPPLLTTARNSSSVGVPSFQA